MTKTLSINDYKRSKRIIRDIEKILPIFNKTYSNLKHYMHYRHVMEVMNSINDARIILEIHLHNERRNLNYSDDENI